MGMQGSKSYKYLHDLFPAAFYIAEAIFSQKLVAVRTCDLYPVSILNVAHELIVDYRHTDNLFLAKT
jgi:hypothetical protein